MTEISRTALFGKLNNLAYKGIESATVFCKMRNNPYVELVHWLHQILQLPDSDLHRIIKKFEVNPSRLAQDFVGLLDRLPSGASSLSDFSIDVEESIEKGWLYASLKYANNQIRSGHLLIGIIKTPALRNKLLMISQEFKKINPAYIIPIDCTGRKAIVEMEKHMPEQLISNMVGTKLTFN